MVDCSQSGMFDMLVERFKTKTFSRWIVVQHTGILKQVSLSKMMTTVFHYNLRWQKRTEALKQSLSKYDSLLLPSCQVFNGNVLKMIDGRPGLAADCDADHVNPNRQPGVEVAFKVRVNGGLQPLHFSDRDRFFGVTAQVVRAGFNLNENQRVALLADEINLAAADAEVSREDAVTLSAQKPAGDSFAGFAGSMFRRE